MAKNQEDAQKAKAKALSQWYTPFWLIHAALDLVQEHCPLKEGEDVWLDPAAGDGRLLRAAHGRNKGCNYAHLYDLDFPEVRTSAYFEEEKHHQDFLTAEPIKAHWSFQNTPYENGKDAAFIDHALKSVPQVTAVIKSDLLNNKNLANALTANSANITHILALPRPSFEGPYHYGAEKNFCVINIEKKGRRRKAAKHTRWLNFRLMGYQKDLRWLKDPLGTIKLDDCLVQWDCEPLAFTHTTKKGEYYFHSIIGEHVPSYFAVPIEKGEHIPLDSTLKMRHLITSRETLIIHFDQGGNYTNPKPALARLRTAYKDGWEKLLPG